MKTLKSDMSYGRMSIGATLTPTAVPSKKIHTLSVSKLPAKLDASPNTAVSASVALNGTVLPTVSAALPQPRAPWATKANMAARQPDRRSAPRLSMSEQRWTDDHHARHH